MASENESRVLQQLISRPRDPFPSYVRAHSNESDALEAKLGRAFPLGEGARDWAQCSVLPSGTCAIETALVSLLLMIREHQSLPPPKGNSGRTAAGSQTHLFHLSRGQMFSGTFKTIAWVNKLRLNDTVLPFELGETTAVTRELLVELFRKHVRPNDTVVYFLETCANPTGQMPDWQLFRGPFFTRQCHRIYLVIDNTWVTHEMFNPFLPPASADLVVSSLTKYYSGGTAIAGAWWYPSRLKHLFLDYARPRGMHVSPDTCALLNRQFDSLSERMRRISQLASQAIAWLEAHLAAPVVRIHYACPKKLKGCHAGVVALDVALAVPQSIEWMQRSGFQMATSFGGSRTRFDTFPAKLDAQLTRCRLAFGSEDSVDFVLKGLAKLFA